LLGRRWRLFAVLFAVFFLVLFILLLAVLDVFGWGAFGVLLVVPGIGLVIGLAWAFHNPKERVVDGDVFVKEFSIEEGREFLKSYVNRWDAPVNLRFGSREYSEFPYHYFKDVVYVYENVRVVKGGFVDFISFCIRADDPKLINHFKNIGGSELLGMAKRMCRTTETEDSEVIVRTNEMTGITEKVVRRNPRVANKPDDEPLSPKTKEVVGNA